MENLSASLRAELDARFTLRSSILAKTLPSPDGTVKLQISLGSDGTDACTSGTFNIEAVILTDKSGRKTACLSTQAGCPAACVFCRTGSLGLKRNLSASEIVEQLLHIQEYLKSAEDTADCGEAPRIDTIVIMGMGEPLLNIDALYRALRVFTAPDGFAMSARRITVSTCGIVKGIRTLTDTFPDVRLALSLTTGREELRRRLMPITAANPLAEVKTALVEYQCKRGKRVTIEAVLLGGINTQHEDIAAMIDFTAGLDVMINLIPWNPSAGLSFEGRALIPPSRDELSRFETALKSAGLNVARRFRRGGSVNGACGQLG
jgi:23S rRNA (adenine2503-C2)-methyltransferase